MPWRDNTSTYAILVSEIMLQQTQVSRVLILFPRFVKQFPSFAALARAKQSAAIRAWQGLGYNRRALALHRAARIIMERFSGQLPKDRRALLSLPGIGPATASSIRAFAFNIPEVFIETNIRSVFIHEFFPRRKKVRDEELTPLIAAALDRKNPREWYWSLMDYGAHIKSLHKNPNRRSAQYARQSPFHGSLRKVRGEILKALAAAPSLSAAHLREKISAPQGHFSGALSALIREGFCDNSQGNVSLI